MDIHLKSDIGNPISISQLSLTLWITSALVNRILNIFESNFLWVPDCLRKSSKGVTLWQISTFHFKASTGFFTNSYWLDLFGNQPNLEGNFFSESNPKELPSWWDVSIFISYTQQSQNRMQPHGAEKWKQAKGDCPGISIGWHFAHTFMIAKK